MKLGWLSVVDPQKINKEINDEGSCSKYCVETAKGIEYIKFDKANRVFAEVLSSLILHNVGVESVPYRFLKEKNGRSGTISRNFKTDCKYYFTLYEAGKLLGRIDEDKFDHIYCDKKKAMEIIDGFCGIRPLLKYTKEDKNKIEDKIVLQCIADYFLCNSDHHTKNIELLIYENDKKERSIELCPAFDFGMCLQTPNSRLALSLEEGEGKVSNLSEEYSKEIIKYLRTLGKTAKEIANNRIFQICCNLINFNIHEACMNVLAGTIDVNNYKNLNIDKEVIDQLYDNLIEKFNEVTGLDLKTKDIFNMIRAFEERRNIFEDELVNDDVLFEAYNMNGNRMNEFVGFASEVDEIKDYNYGYVFPNTINRPIKK